MRWTDTLIPTLRDDPLEAEIASHKLMLRAGLIRKLAGGLYTFLPLGLRALRKVERIAREEMDRAGALEILMPALQPREIWEQSKRYAVMGETMYRLQDRQKRDLVLGPTHEEVVTDLVSREISSYRQLPKIFYQIQAKFRDEIRPRFGLMRAREFIMKDAYSFDVSMEAADASYQRMYNAYRRIFDRCGLTTRIVEADTGAMGGKLSHEFMALADSGEDGLVECDSCSCAANLERAERGFLPTPLFPDAGESPLVVPTPGARTIEQVAAFFGCEPRRLIKTILYLVKGEPVAVLAPGDREINEHKLARALETADVTMADPRAIETVTGAAVGFAGPVGLQAPIYADTALKGYAGAISGANRTDAHMTRVCLERDVRVAGYLDLCAARDGDPCPRCNGKLREKRGIEVGHVFKLGAKYSDAFGASYVPDDGRRRAMVMGCYGIGVTRTLQAVIEQNHDDKGINWPMSVAPYHAVVLVLNPAHAASLQTAQDLAQNLDASGVETVLDDRNDRPGVKFADADLIGFPLRVVVSERSLAKNSVELKQRTQPSPELVPIADAARSVGDIVHARS
ncbi:MAG: proline--tRNA ligase [Verrucomicrobiota bacterium]|nr:proline--tRNA ligase [Verrucomicrobiota bacterium]